MNDFSEVVKILTENGKKISIMESCTGGAIANAITNIPGSSLVFNFGAVTYSNEYKIKMGVDSAIIDKYSVYSMETANEMSKKITDFTLTNYGIGVTGKINRSDISNPYGKDNIIFVSIYDRDNDKYYSSIVKAIYHLREDNKKLIISETIKLLFNILNS